jgi:LDH2 family malate/lactate/ureidoglycolate dehydrogenase
MRPPPTWGERLAGVFVVAIDPAAFGDAAAYRRQVAGVLDQLEAVPPAPGAGRVLVPGDVERASRERRSDGIPLPEATWEELSGFAGRFGVPLPTGRAMP